MLRASLSDAARLHHQNLIRSLQPDQPMGDHQRCSPLDQVVDGAQHFMLGTSIEVGGWFVENHDGGVFENGARDGARDSEPLAFSPAQFETLLSDQCVIALGQRFDHTVDR